MHIEDYGDYQCSGRKDQKDLKYQGSVCYEESYYDDVYYSNSNYSINNSTNESYVMAHAEEYLQKLREQSLVQIYGSSSGSSTNNTPNEPKKIVEKPDEIIVWDSSNGMPPTLQ